ncbi:10616_t:CDS:2 [Entrophospora sp. SA101]|nr:10616_t:CDS:2 [Entrophospora sp. SA101]
MIQLEFTQKMNRDIHIVIVDKIIGLNPKYTTKAWRNYKNRPESLATQVWNALKTDDYPNDKKFLGITPQKVNRPSGYDYIDYKSKRLSWHSNSPKLWAESKKSLLTYRLYDYVVNLLQQNGYRLIGGRSCKGHEWSASFSNIKNRRMWCRKCLAFTIDDAREYAKNHNGYCLSTQYINGKVPLLWKCAKGHEWSVPFINIKNSRTWCNKCRSLTLKDAIKVGKK